MDRYVALLRGINVGGHKKVPMKDLKATLEKHGFQNVKTLLASGNVVFTAEKSKLGGVQALLESTFGFTISTIILPLEKIVEIVASNPFKTISVTPKIRLYVTFLKEESKTNLVIPYHSEDHSFQILKLENLVIFSVLNLDKAGTIDAMGILEKEFGKNITTRNFNTVVKIAKL